MQPALLLERLDIDSDSYGVSQQKKNISCSGKHLYMVLVSYSHVTLFNWSIHIKEVSVHSSLVVHSCRSAGNHIKLYGTVKIQSSCFISGGGIVP